MKRRQYLLAGVAILLILAIGLVGYFAFSAAYGDGLERTMEDSGVEESEPFWSAPLNYGEDYIGALFAGAVGFTLVLLLILGYLYLVKRRKGPSNKAE